LKLSLPRLAADSEAASEAAALETVTARQELSGVARVAVAVAVMVAEEPSQGQFQQHFRSDGVCALRHPEEGVEQHKQQ
jgi:hypothetical protein